ncbi:MAG: glycine betaine ABC transporter substrate-binding protein [Candidatus Cryosericum sp.]|nr:glycine betaine ABC transporter substrate-binding protein [Candidatus Cryosericum sp.]
MRRCAALVLVIVLVATVGLSGCSSPQGKSITIASKDFTEGYVLTSLVAGLLQNAGFTVNEKAGMKTLIIRTALLSKQIDAYVEFTGTAWTTHLKQTEVIRDPVQLFDAVRRMDLADNGIDWVSRIDFNDTYALAIRPADAEKFGNSISSLAAYVAGHPDEPLFAVNAEFYQRPDGFPALTAFYGMSIPSSRVKIMDAGLTYQALSDGQVDVAMVYATDGLLRKFGLTVLDDDKSFFPPYNPALCIQKDVLARYPEIPDILAPLTTKLTTQDIIDLNYAVVVEGQSPQAAAERYLKEKGLVK